MSKTKIIYQNNLETKVEATLSFDIAGPQWINLRINRTEINSRRGHI